MKAPAVISKASNYPKMLDTRLSQIHFSLEDNKVDGLVVNYMPNIRYLTNFSGSAGLLFITFDDMYFITDDRYEEQIKDELFGYPSLKSYISRDPWKFIKDKKILKGVNSLAFEADRMYYSDAVNIRNLIRPLKFKPAPYIVEPFTVPKSPEEVEYISKSCQISEEVYEKVLDMIKPGVTERELALEIAYQSRLLGSEEDAFPIIVTSGPRGGLVHGMPTDRAFKSGDLIIMDFGCKVNGFVSDITRTVAVGKATRDQKKMYKMLVKAKDDAIAAVKPGMNGKTLDGIARNVIKKEGFGEFFQHSLGHGIGLVPHEKPTLTFRMDDQIIPESSVLAIEPGVYFPDKYGMRVEDNIQVTRNGGRYLSQAPEDLPVI